MSAPPESAAQEALQVVGPILFLLFAGMAAAGAAAAVVARNIVRMAVCLLFALFAVSMLYFYVGVEFLGAIQLIVYVGGTLILIVFGIMLTGRSLVQSASASRLQQVLGWVIAFAITAATAALGLAITKSPAGPFPAVISHTTTSAPVSEGVARTGTPLTPDAIAAPEVTRLLRGPVSPALAAEPFEPQVEDFGRAMVTRYVLQFEVAGLLLLVVMVGAAYIAKRREGQSPLRITVVRRAESESGGR